MSIKIIAVPILILIIMVFSIWYLYPAYTEMNDVSQKTAEEEGKLKDFDEKIITISDLANQIKSANEQQDALLEFIPSQKKEEDIINELNSISFTYKLSILEITFEKPKDANIQTADSMGNPLAIDPTTGEVATLDPVTGQSIVSAVPKPKDVNVRMIGVGNYDQIKAVLRKLEKSKRYNGLKSVKIFKEESLTGQDDSNNEENAKLLKMEITINLNYLDGVKKIDSPDNNIFSIKKLDLSIAKKISDEKNSVIPDINMTSVGSSNPFFKDQAI